MILLKMLNTSCRARSTDIFDNPPSTIEDSYNQSTQENKAWFLRQMCGGCAPASARLPSFISRTTSLSLFWKNHRLLQECRKEALREVLSQPAAFDKASRGEKSGGLSIHLS
jgi:hypothetical protein